MTKVPERIRATRRRAAGQRETLRAIREGRARVVYVALDADDFIIEPVINLTARSGCELVKIESMGQLGRLCGIPVGAACAALLNEA
ncbi:MAG TPA: 50S ribosomal protein L7Ae-like protein [Firmicutes bacterium]|nr:50S ribosomal protein L7Ae-like protein [Bacillota bacterium]